jgi:hypothetical protein
VVFRLLRRGMVLVVGLGLLAGAAGCGGEPEPASRSLAGAVGDGVLGSAPFYFSDHGVAVESVQLSGGAYYPGNGQAGDVPHIRIASEPSIVDVDGDGSDEVAAVLEWTGESDKDYSGWKAVYAWRWIGNALQPVRTPLAWQWSCAESASGDARFGDISRLDGGGIQLSRRQGNYCGADAVADNPTSPVKIRVRDEIPMLQLDNGWAATEACRRDSELDDADAGFLDAPDSVTPLVFPADGSATVSNEDSKREAVRVWQPELADDGRRGDHERLHNDYLPATVTWRDGTTACGWVPATEVQ